MARLGAPNSGEVWAVQREVDFVELTGPRADVSSELGVAIGLLECAGHEIREGRHVRDGHASCHTTSSQRHAQRCGKHCQATDLPPIGQEAMCPEGKSP
jgi:hypothetical protein